MHRLIFVYVIIILMAGIASAQSEVYNYKDAQGNNVFTDDLSQVPEDQRANVNSQKSIKSKPIQQRPKPPKPAPVVPKNTDKTLDALKQWLTDENDALKQEKESLEAMKPEINLPKDQQDYNAKVRSINQRIDIYKEKLADYQDKLKEFDK